MSFLYLLFITVLYAHPLSSDIFGHEIQIYVPYESQNEVVVDYTLEIPISVLQQELLEYETGRENTSAIQFQRYKIDEITSFIRLEIDGTPIEWNDKKLKTDTLQRKNQMVVFDVRMKAVFPSGEHSVRIVNQNYPLQKSVYRKDLWLQEPFLGLVVPDLEQFGHWLILEDMREIEFLYQTQQSWTVMPSRLIRVYALGQEKQIDIRDWEIFDIDIWERMSKKLLHWYEVCLIVVISLVFLFEPLKKFEWIGILPCILLSQFLFPNAFLLWITCFVASFALFVFQRWKVLFVVPLFYATNPTFSIVLVLSYMTIQYLRSLYKM